MAKDKTTINVDDDNEDLFPLYADDLQEIVLPELLPEEWDVTLWDGMEELIGSEEQDEEDVKKDFLSMNLLCYFPEGVSAEDHAFIIDEICELFDKYFEDSQLNIFSKRENEEEVEKNS